jgi:hypothetical protein
MHFLLETTKTLTAALNLVCNTKRFKNGWNWNRALIKYLLYKETRQPTQRCVLLLLRDLTFRSKWKSWVCIMRSAFFAFSNGTTGEATKPFDHLHTNLRSSYKSVQTLFQHHLYLDLIWKFQITLQHSQSLIHTSGIQTNQLQSPFQTIIFMQYCTHSTYLYHWLYV